MLSLLDECYNLVTPLSKPRKDIFFWQILSGKFLKGYGKDVINIHHGLLPSFKGGYPAKQVFRFSHGFYTLSLCYVSLSILDSLCRRLMQV